MNNIHFKTIIWLTNYVIHGEQIFTLALPLTPGGAGGGIFYITHSITVFPAASQQLSASHVILRILSFV